MNLLPSVRHIRSGEAIRPLPDAVTLDGPAADRMARTVSRVLGIDRIAPQAGLSIRWMKADAWPALDDDESYQLQVSASGVRIDAATLRGAQHGVMSLAQLADGDGLRCADITDAPRFPWRGLMLDPARRFLPVKRLEAVIDGLAALKLNVLHLHLSDDQGFRFESKAWPRLASAEAYRQDELKALVEFAADRGVRIVPELDMPGHVTSWLTAYPEWGNRRVEPTTRFGVHPGCLDPTSEPVYAAIGQLLDEVCAVFPDHYVHIGGDEVHSSWWRDDPAIQAFMQAQGLADTTALQAYFNRRVVAMLRERGRRVIGWDEVLHPDLPAEVTVQGWRGAKARDRALAAGHDCIVSSAYYLDLFYPGAIHRKATPDLAEADLIAAEDGLLNDARFEHVAAGMKWTHAWRAARPVERSVPPGRLLGGEACLWGELVNDHCLDGRLWSRLPDIAECFWAQQPEADDGALRTRWPAVVHRRLQANRQRLAAVVAQDQDVLEGLELCEPVKWYARLLGEVALNARIRGTEMPQARPYGTASRLDRAVDFLLPESLVCQDVRRWSLNEIAEGCRRWARLDRLNEVPGDVQPVFAVIASAARIWLDCLAGDLSKEEASQAIRNLYRPCGEYMPAIVLVLSERLA